MPSFALLLHLLMARRARFAFMANGFAFVSAGEFQPAGKGTRRTYAGMTGMVLNFGVMTMTGFLTQIGAFRVEGPSEPLAREALRRLPALARHLYLHRACRTGARMTRQLACVSATIQRLPAHLLLIPSSHIDHGAHGMVSVATPSPTAVSAAGAQLLALLLTEQFLGALAECLLAPTTAGFHHELLTRRAWRWVALERAVMAAGKNLAAGLMTRGRGVCAWNVKFWGLGGKQGITLLSAETRARGFVGAGLAFALMTRLFACVEATVEKPSADSAAGVLC